MQSKSRHLEAEKMKSLEENKWYSTHAYTQWSRFFCSRFISFRFFFTWVRAIARARAPWNACSDGDDDDDNDKRKIVLFCFALLCFSFSGQTRNLALLVCIACQKNYVGESTTKYREQKCNVRSRMHFAHSTFSRMRNVLWFFCICTVHIFVISLTLSLSAVYLFASFTVHFRSVVLSCLPFFNQIAIIVCQYIILIIANFTSAIFGSAGCFLSLCVRRSIEWMSHELLLWRAQWKSSH